MLNKVPISTLLTRPVISWILYDLANTIFSMNIVSLYFGLWMVEVMHGTDSNLGFAESISMGLVFLTAPILGAISDQAGRRLPFLLVTTLICILFTSLIGAGSLAWGLVCFVIANYFFQAGLIFYDSTLPTVSTPETRGTISGLGVGIGYVGSFIGVSAGMLLKDHGYPFLFVVTAVLFLFFSIPIFLFVKESHSAPNFKFSRHTMTKAFGQIRTTFQKARKYRGLGRFLIARVFYMDPVNTVILFMGIYVTQEIGFTRTQAEQVMIVAIVTAIFGGILWGRMVDRIGPKRTLNLVLAIWMVALCGAVIIASQDLPNQLFWIIACMIGIGLGGIATADRPFMLVLSPPAYLGEFYGIYSMVGRFAAVIGPMLWSFVVETLGLGRQAALTTLLGMIVIAFFILRKVDDSPREWSEEERLKSP